MDKALEYFKKYMEEQGYPDSEIQLTLASFALGASQRAAARELAIPVQATASTHPSGGDNEPAKKNPKRTRKRKTAPEPVSTPVPTGQQEENLGEFVFPKKTSPQAKKKQPQSETVTENSFAVLEEMDTAIEKPTSEAKKPRRGIPPIVLREKEKWITLVKEIKAQQIQFTGARDTKEGIRIQPSSEEDHRKLQLLMIEMGLFYHTFRLKSEKPISAVIRGIPEGIETEDIKEALRTQNIPVIKVTRMCTGPDRRPLPLMMASVEKSEDGMKIFDLKAIFHLRIKVEAKRKKQTVIQCYRCQKFGHFAASCFAETRCVRCTGAHRTNECPLDRASPAKCANCGGAHPASYRGCKEFPAPPKKQTTPTARHAGKRAGAGRTEAKPPPKKKEDNRENRRGGPQGHEPKENSRAENTSKIIDAIRGMPALLENLVKATTTTEVIEAIIKAVLDLLK